MRPLQCEGNGRPTRKPTAERGLRRGQDPALQCKTNAMQTVDTQRYNRFAGGIYAAPTHGPNAVTTQKRYHGANGHGGVKTPPYNARQTPCKPWTRNGITVLRAAYMPPLRIDRTRSQRKKRYCRANGHGGVKTPPYKVKKTPCQPGSLRVLWRRKTNFRAAAGRDPPSFLFFNF